ncbi:MAG: hypothetical protein HQK96_20075 [Nitrospirae bacterium]|nr:hypothetical protein [Nitrospirota bacterium]
MARPTSRDIDNLLSKHQPKQSGGSGQHGTNASTVTHTTTEAPVTASDERKPVQEHKQVSPYYFAGRPMPTRKDHISHEKLQDERFDIAFTITWKTLTPTAANPCVDSDPNVEENAFEEYKKDYKGYNRRWLMIDNRLAISPFTVKSAIANGFANLYPW